jgi:hypothetical protein
MILILGSILAACKAVLDLHDLYHLQGVSVHCPEATMLQKLPRTTTKSCIYNKPTNSHNTHWNYCTTTSTSLTSPASLAVLPYLQRIISFATNTIIKGILNVYFGGKVVNICSLCFCYSVEALGFNCVLLININDERHLFFSWRKRSQIHGLITIVVCWELEVQTCQSTAL